MSISRRLRVVFVLIVVFAFAGPHALLGQRSAQNAPGGPKASAASSPWWQPRAGRTEKPSPRSKSAKLSMEFDTIEPQEGSARYAGGDTNLAVSDIIAQLSGGSLHLMQTSRSGAVYLTTVYPSESRNGKLKAVHARHLYTEVSLPGYTSSTEQYYGECEAKP